MPPVSSSAAFSQRHVSCCSFSHTSPASVSQQTQSTTQPSPVVTAKRLNTGWGSSGGSSGPGRAGAFPQAEGLRGAGLLTAPARPQDTSPGASSRKIQAGTTPKASSFPESLLPGPCCWRGGKGKGAAQPRQEPQAPKPMQRPAALRGSSPRAFARSLPTRSTSSTVAAPAGSVPAAAEHLQTRTCPSTLPRCRQGSVGQS